jgi:hypothetical protein
MEVAELYKHHEGILQLLEECREENFASGRMSPIKRTIRHWHDQRRLVSLRPRTET